MKQGDALSCGIFILCIDPLIRNINNDRNIKIISIEMRFTKEKIDYKAGAVADDVGVICGNDLRSIQGVFKQLERLTRRSGLELNTDKTEILLLHAEIVSIISNN